MDGISTILKKRIKEMGYTQVEFAEECGMSLTTLKVYLDEKSKIRYNIETLELFSQKLNCSYDYLLGKSETPKREIQTLKEQTHLSDNALLSLQLNAADYEKAPEVNCDEIRKAVAENDLIVASLILEDAELLGLIKNYIFLDEKDKYFNGKFSFVEIGGAMIRSSDVKNILLTKIINRLVAIEESFSKLERKQDVLTREVSENVKKRSREWLHKETE